MSNPRFAIGDKVAVCTFPEFPVVIPSTVITDSELVQTGEPGITFNGEHGIATRDFWAYLVADADDNWIAEEYIRPLNPDDYSITEDTQDIHAPITEGAQ